ncbi:MAG: hypothetical protein FIB07_02905 [Candidatus Methanoperedens sp.]|nr:hypothetical protein [Candidatus Methanoperedens sp.]
MRTFLQLSRLWEKKLKNRGNKIVGPFLFTVLAIIFLAAIISITNAPETGYSPTSERCISCHNDTTFPNDTNGDGVLAPYKRPHNNTVMCESCHLTNPHTLGFIQTNGLYGSKSTATSCPGCHQGNISNMNFTSAPKIPVNFTHSNKPSNGTRWGNYWNNTEPRTACKFCHDNTLHNTTPIGRILNWTSDKQYASCSGCHYKGDSNWSFMKSTFESAGLNVPPEITNGTSWNGNSVDYFNHTLESYDNEFCKYCHGELAGRNASFKDFVHNVAEAEGSECMGCHRNPQIGKDDITYPAIELESFGKHSNTNTSSGNNDLTNDDCITCHYDFNFSEMMLGGFTTKTKICTDCHTEGNFSALIIKNHKPPKVDISAGGNITTTAYCSTCHNNSINKYAYSVNASVGHYGTNESLVNTVNQTSKPRFGFMSQGDAQNYNKDCNNCHNPSNSSYGNATLITTGHIGKATCNGCHVDGSASDLHNESLGIPVTFNCRSCHTTYADKYGAANLSETNMADYSTCGGSNCHLGISNTSSLDTLEKHNVDRTFSGTGGSTDTVYLNNNVSLTVTKGTPVEVTARVKDALGAASRVGGAEYYIDVDPGQGKGIPMDALDGLYNAVKGNWESINATLDTSSLSDGNHTIFVRGMDIGKQWSATKNATLIVQSNGLISGAVTNNSSAIAGALITVSGGSTFTYTDINGNYALAIQSGTYNVTASKQPEFYDNTSNGVVVYPGNTTIQNLNLILKLKGIISGIVTSI